MMCYVDPMKAPIGDMEGCLNAGITLDFGDYRMVPIIREGEPNMLEIQQSENDEFLPWVTIEGTSFFPLTFDYVLAAAAIISERMTEDNLDRR